MFPQAGTLDPSFADGMQISYLNFLSSDEEWVTHSITDSQNRIWLAGQTYQSNEWRLILARLDANGNYDESFGGTGYTVLTIGNGYTNVQGVVLQNDNLLVTGSILQNGVNTPYLIRFTADGVLDDTFGEDGIATPNVNMMVSNIITDEEGAIYISGVLEDNVMALKFLADGGLDQSFGFFGATIAEFPSLDQSVALDLDEAGNIYIFGYGELNQVTRGQVTSFAPNGSINTEFTGNGRKSITWPDGKQFRVNDGLLESSNNKLFLVGRIEDQEGNLNTGAVSIGISSDQDMTFGEEGWLEIDVALGGDDFATFVEEGPNGLYLGLNTQEVPQGIDAQVLNIDLTGQRIESFGSNGLTNINIEPQGADQALSISFQSDGKLILTGIAESEEVGAYGYAVRLLTDNTSDTKTIDSFSEFSIYPNPASDRITISYKNKNFGGQVYRIFNITGSVVASGTLQYIEERIDVSHLPPSSYFFQVGSQKPQQWIKNR